MMTEKFWAVILAGVILYWAVCLYPKFRAHVIKMHKSFMNKKKKD